LNELENPTPSINVAAAPVATAVQPKPATIKVQLPTLQDAVGLPPELGGFQLEPPLINPAAVVADRLDQKLNSPASSAPKEVYQIKRPDPYHEPIEP